MKVIGIGLILGTSVAGIFLVLTGGTSPTTPFLTFIGAIIVILDEIINK